MKRSVAAVLGVVAAGGIAIGVYEATGSSGHPSATESAPTSSQQPSAHTPSGAPVAPSAARPTLPPSAGSATVTAGGATASSVNATAATNLSVDPAANRAAGTPIERNGVAALKPRLKQPAPTAAANTPEAQAKQRALSQQRMNQRFEAAACRSPGIADRMTKMSEAEREKLRTRCATAGVKL